MPLHGGVWGGGGYVGVCVGVYGCVCVWVGVMVGVDGWVSGVEWGEGGVGERGG